MPINSKDHPDLWAAKVRRFHRRLDERQARRRIVAALTDIDVPPIISNNVYRDEQGVIHERNKRPNDCAEEEAEQNEADQTMESPPHLKLVE